MAFTSANGRTQTALSDINITPLVDVVLVLLIIFMVTAPSCSPESKSTCPIPGPSKRSPKSAW